jgi:hypothetical protein
MKQIIYYLPYIIFHLGIGFLTLALIVKFGNGTIGETERSREGALMIVWGGTFSLLLLTLTLMLIYLWKLLSKILKFIFLNLFDKIFKFLDNMIDKYIKFIERKFN